MRVALFLPNWIGDAVMATPAIRAIHSRFGRDAELIGVMQPTVAKVLAGLDWFDETILFQPRSSDRTRRMPAVIAQLRANPCDWHVLFPNSLRAGLMSWAGRGVRRVGFAGSGRRWLLTHAIDPPPDQRDRSALDVYLDLAATTGADVSDRRMQLAVREEDHREVDELWGRLGLRADERVVVLNNGGAFGPSKLWPADYVAKLGRMLANEGRQVVIVCGPDEAEIAEETAAAADSPGVHVASRPVLSLGGLKAIFGRASAVVTTDTGPRHIATARGAAAVVLFGPLPASISENHAATERRLQLDLECAPCRSKVCPLGHHQCMRDLTPERVLREVHALLEETAPQRASA